MEAIFTEIKALVDYIQSVYTPITKEWEAIATGRTNLRKTRVEAIVTDGQIYNNITQYVQFLNDRCAEISLQLSNVCNYKVTARVKTQNSIEYKIQSYKGERHENGKVAINKCINDLFGIRVILPIPLTFEVVHDFIEKTYQGQYKCIDSSKGLYKAIHLYFKGDNYTFPWELQIWNECDSKTNFDSHSMYKQEYTSWERESKEGGISNG